MAWIGGRVGRRVERVLQLVALALPAALLATSFVDPTAAVVSSSTVSWVALVLVWAALLAFLVRIRRMRREGQENSRELSRLDAGDRTVVLRAWRPGGVPPRLVGHVERHGRATAAALERFVWVAVGFAWSQVDAASDRSYPAWWLSATTVIGAAVAGPAMLLGAARWRRAVDELPPVGSGLGESR